MPKEENVIKEFGELEQKFNTTISQFFSDWETLKKTKETKISEKNLDQKLIDRVKNTSSKLISLDDSFKKICKEEYREIVNKSEETTTLFLNLFQNFQFSKIFDYFKENDPNVKITYNINKWILEFVDCCLENKKDSVLDQFLDTYDEEGKDDCLYTCIILNINKKTNTEEEKEKLNNKVKELFERINNHKNYGSNLEIFKSSIVNNYLFAIEQLLEKGFSPPTNLFFDNGLSALHIVVENNNPQLLAKLIEHGADINVKIKDNETNILIHAILYSNKESIESITDIIFKNLKDSKEMINSENNKFNSLTAALFKENLPLAEKIIKYGANLYSSLVTASLVELTLAKKYEPVNFLIKMVMMLIQQTVVH